MMRTKAMFEDAIDYQYTQKEYVHTYPGWRSDKTWLHVMVSKHELDMLRQMETQDHNRHELIGELILKAYNKKLTLKE
ncbi:MAG: hypothetical protein PHT79_06380 [Syntrophomonadaceae bacterium]|nr:hypothetical protein [Syntrophomonadaceae bacterium]MDD3889104.1 hypothetical protein [Syntrophomonadaceae bacterium]MDD4549371.1 hypothetical protein [Syntrophomonadaceae bacterium]